MLAAPAGLRLHVATYKDYYQIIGVARDASQDDIKRAYRRLARKFHPDVSKEANAEDKFKEVQEAYEVLKDPQRRAAYDQLGSNWRAGQEFRPPPDWGRDFEFSTSSFGGAGGGQADFSDFFASLFGQRSPFGQQRSSFGGGGRGRGGFAAAGEDHVAKIQIELEDAFRGGSQTIELKAPQLGDDGRVTVQPRTLKVTIPAGVIEGQRIRLAGQGSPGAGGGPAGDLYLENWLSPAPAVHRRRPRPDADVADRTLGSGARRDGANTDAGRTRRPAHSPERESGTEDAAQGSRSAGPDGRRSIRRAEDRAAAGGHTARERAL